VLFGGQGESVLDANAKAAELHLTAEEMAELDSILTDEVSD